MAACRSSQITSRAVRRSLARSNITTGHYVQLELSMAFEGVADSVCHFLGVTWIQYGTSKKTYKETNEFA
jgi:hypothetical protein